MFSIPLGGNALGSVAGVYTPIQVVSTGGALTKGTIGQSSDITDYNGVNTESLGACLLYTSTRKALPTGLPS